MGTVICRCSSWIIAQAECRIPGIHTIFLASFQAASDRYSNGKLRHRSGRETANRSSLPPDEERRVAMSDGWIDDMQSEESFSQILKHSPLSAIGLTVWAFVSLLRARRRSARLSAIILRDQRESAPLAGICRESETDSRRRILAVRIVSAHSRGFFTCLHGALVLHEWFSRRGIRCSLEIGWTGDAAHAWVRHGKDLECTTLESRFSSIVKST